jgi:DNA-binding CsgD family transcriptional regulator
MVAAARPAQLGNHMETARDLLEEALTWAQDPRLRVDARHLLAFSLIWTGQAQSGHRLLLAETDTLRYQDPRRAALLLADAALPCFLTRDVSAALAVARRAYDLAQSLDCVPRFAAAAVLGAALMFAGQSQAATPLLDEAGALALGEVDPSARGAPGVGHAVMVAKCLTWLERFEEARTIFDRTSRAARARCAVGLLPFLLSAQTDFAYQVGDWPAALAYGGEAARLGEETGESGQRAYALCGLARLAAAQGRSDDCHTLLRASMEFADQTDLRTMRVRATAIRGLLSLGRGEYERATAELERLVGHPALFDVREPSLLPWVPDLIEAYVCSGRPAEASRLLAGFSDVVEDSPRPSVLATLHRCRALVAMGQTSTRRVDVGDAAEHFDAAIGLHDRTAVVFEQARTHLCHGAWLRRSGRPSAARTPLRVAVDIFDRLEAGPWSARARAELRATGEKRARRPSTPQIQTLTPQETAVATAVARGMTNQETADALFLSAKTVAFHLTNVYRKLGLRSRAQLAARLTTVRPPKDGSADPSRDPETQQP